MPSDDSEADASAARPDPQTAPHAGLLSDLSPNFPPNLLEDALRLPLDRLMREARLWAIAPCLRQYANTRKTCWARPARWRILSAIPNN